MKKSELIQFKFLFVFILLILMSTITASPDQISVPEPLTTNNFKEELKNGLHIVDFYSPYCSHCKSLEPIWEEAYKEFYEEGKKLKISFSKVNCIESGDICSMEQIAYYPNIRLYGPSGFLKAFPNDIPRSKENLIKFARKSASEKDNFKSSKTKSVSKSLSGEHLQSLVDNINPNSKGVLISFWPTKNMLKSDQDIRIDDCENCIPFQNTWSVLSSAASNKNFNVFHINCVAYKSVCSKFGFDELTTGSHSEKSPGVAYILPNNKMNRFWKYSNGFSLNSEDYINWALKLNSNSELNAYPIKYSQKTAEQSYISSMLSDNIASSEIRVVFVQDARNVPIPRTHMESLSKLGVNLYQSDSKLISNFEKIFSPINELLRYNKTEAKKEFDQEYINIFKNVNLPAYLIWKDGNLLPKIVSTTSSETHDVDLLTETIKSIRGMKYATMQKLPQSDKELRELYNLDSSSYIVLQIINRADIKESSKFLLKTITGIYDYYHTRSKYIIAMMKASSDHISNILKKMSSGTELSSKEKNELQLSFDKVTKENVDLVYVDISEDTFFKERLHLPERIEGYKSGDAVVIDKKNQIFYTKDIFDNNLHSLSTYSLYQCLLAVMLPKYAHSPVTLTGYKRFDAFSYILYLIGFILIGLCYRFRRSIFRKRTRKEKTGLGILDHPKGNLKD